MKTPEEIKKGLECCSPDDVPLGFAYCRLCPYLEQCMNDGSKVLKKDTLAYVEQLETENKKLKELRDQVWMKKIRGYCGACKHNHADEQVNFKCWECLFKTKTRNPNSEEYHPLWEYDG